MDFLIFLLKTLKELILKWKCLTKTRRETLFLVEIRSPFANDLIFLLLLSKASESDIQASWKLRARFCTFFLGQKYILGSKGTIRWSGVAITGCHGIGNEGERRRLIETWRGRARRTTDSSWVLLTRPATQSGSLYRRCTLNSECNGRVHAAFIRAQARLLASLAICELEEPKVSGVETVTMARRSIEEIPFFFQFSCQRTSFYFVSQILHFFANWNLDSKIFFNQGSWIYFRVSSNFK